MEHINYDSLLIITVLAFLTPIISSLIRKIAIPVVVIEITLGIIIGKSGLNLIEVSSVIVFLSSLGLAYLMFLSGLEIDFDMINDRKNNRKFQLRNPLLISTIIFTVSLGVSFFISWYMYSNGLIENIYFIALIFAASAPGIIIPVLTQSKIINSSFGQTLLIFSIIAEFVTLILIAVVISVLTTGLSVQNFLFVMVFIAFFVIYFITKRAVMRFAFSSPILHTQHLRVRAAFALILILGSISHKVGAEIILGSFLAGVIFSLITDKTKEELKSNLEAIGYGFLIPIFFIMVGVNLNLRPIFSSLDVLKLIPLILFAVLVVKLLPSLILSLFYGFRRSVAAGFLLASQLSLMIVGAQLAFDAGLIDESMHSTFVLVAVLSSLLFPPIFIKLYGKSKTENNNSRHIINKIQMKELIISNEDIFNKKLSQISFPDSCRVFLIVRDEQELIPNGNTVLLENDHLVLIGFKEDLHSLENFLLPQTNTLNI